MADLRPRLERRIRIYRRRRIARVATGSGGLFALAGMLMAVGWWFPPVWAIAGLLAAVSLVFAVIGPVTMLELL